MKTGVKVVTGLFLFFILVVAGLSAFVRYYLTDERLTEMLIPPAEKALGRQVEIDSIGVSLFKGITVRNLSIKEADGKQDFISSGSFVLRYDLMPLLQKKLVVSEVRLENPSVRVERDQKGRFNFESLAVLQKKPEQEVEKEDSSSVGVLPIALTVDTITISGARFSLNDAMGELPAVDAGADVTIGLDVGRTLADLRYHGKGEYTVDADYQGVRPKLTGKINFDQDTLSFDNDVLVDGEKIFVSGIVKNFLKVPAVELNVESDKLNIDKLLALVGSLGGEKGSGKSTKSVGKVSGQSGSIGDALPAGLTARGMVQVDQALYKALLVENFKFAYSLEKNIFTVTDLTASTAGGQISSEMSLDLNVPDLAYKGNVGVRSLQFAQLQSALFPKIPESITGGLSTNLSYAGIGTQWPHMKDRLSAEGDFSLLNGALKNSALALSIAQLTGITELKDLVFNGFIGNFRLSEGNVLLKSTIDGKDFDLESKGAIGLDSTLDLPMTIKLSPVLSDKVKQKSSLTRFLADEQGRTTLNLKLTGTMKNPIPTLDTTVVQQQVQETIKQKAFTEIGKALSPNKASDDPASAAESNKPNLEEAGKGLLKGLFGQ